MSRPALETEIVDRDAHERTVALFRERRIVLPTLTQLAQPDTIPTAVIEALAAVDGAEVEIGVTDGNSSCLVRAPGTTSARYVVMPMRL